MSPPAREPADLADRALRDRAVAAARGDAEFDLLVRGGLLFDAVMQAFRPTDIGIVGALVASIHEPGERTDTKMTIDVAGSLVAPGLIDTHMHVESSMVSPAVYAEAVLARGVTTVVWDPHELANVLGIAGVEWALRATRDLPLRFIVLAPSSVPSAPGLECAGATFSGADIAGLLARDHIGGVAEMMDMSGVVGRATRATDIAQEGLASSKLVAGHARGLTGADLNAYAAAGVGTDHEIISADDLLAKLRVGLTIELRGSHDHLLPELAAALGALGHLPPTLTLCTDDVFPDDLHRAGGLDDVARRLIGHGLKPEHALAAASFNAARSLGRPDLGLIAPGRRADIAIFDTAKSLNAHHVIANGVHVAKGGRVMHRISAEADTDLLGSVKCNALSEDDFRVRATGRRVRVATIDRPRFTQWSERLTEVREGIVMPPEDAILIAVVHRHGRTAPVPKVGFLTGWGEWRGAFATTVSHDSHNLTVFAGNESDAAAAANRVIEMGGGMAVAANGKILAELALPLGGLISDAPLAEVAAAFADVRRAMDGIVDWQPPFLVFKACFGATLACNDGPHQTDLGIADVERGEVLTTPVLEIIA